MNRRDFFKGLIHRVLFIGGLAALCYPVLSFITFRKNCTRTIVFHPHQPDSAILFKDGIYLLKGESGTHAFSARCPHLGCGVNYDSVSQRFQCPCHGSVFDLSGKWISGPAKKDLEKITATRNDKGDISMTLTL